MIKKIITITFNLFVFYSCNNANDNHANENHIKITENPAKNTTTYDSTVVNKPEPCKNDSLNAIANIISGIADNSAVYDYIQSSNDFKLFSKNFDKRWNTYDSSRLTVLKNFRNKELAVSVKPQPVLFYPFSGPDVLYMQTFFPSAQKYIMVGLEPVGSLPRFKKEETDSFDVYFNKINASLKAILQFSFFRTQSMKNDLRNEEVDGTLHLLFLFLKRNGNFICSAKPLTLDSLGSMIFVKSFEELKKIKAKTKGVEIKFTDASNNPKTLYYFSLNAANEILKTNKGFLNFISNTESFNTYLKGASYLMHESHFSIIRNIILSESKQVIQDDSGIALRYFIEKGNNWDFTLYGQYTKPIPMFSAFYQKRLDSLYKTLQAKPIGFGIGYNFKDKNSNFMVATRKN